MSKFDPPVEVAQIRAEISAFFDQTDDAGRRIGGARCAVYAFFDYDAEPIYVGQTVEALSGRVGRHLTGRRSDAVGKFVLDPFEVLEIEVWPLFEHQDASIQDRKRIADRLEYAVYQKCLTESRFSAVLNEAAITPAEDIELPRSYRGGIIPDDLYEMRKHRDIRTARRAQTIANLARLISEREIRGKGLGLRRTLLVQAQRLQALAQERWDHFAPMVEDGAPSESDDAFAADDAFGDEEGD